MTFLGDTEVIRYLTETTSDSYTVPYGEYLALEVDTTPFEITSDKPISVVQIVNGPINSGMETNKIFVFLHINYLCLKSSSSIKIE
jgi:hypothetical protein